MIETLNFIAANEKSSEIIEIKVKQEYEQLVPQVPDKDYQELKDSIKKDGQFFPITVNEKGQVIDGHNRFRACQELRIEPKIEVKKFDNPLDEKKFVIESNLKRRHLEIHERAALATELQSVEEEAAKDRQKQTQFSETNQPTIKRLGKILPNREEKEEENKPKPDKKEEGSYKQKEENKARERAAKQAKLSDETLRKYQYVLSKGKPDLVEKMTNGKTKIDRAYKLHKQDEIRQKLLETASAVIELSTDNNKEIKNYYLKQGDFREVTKDIPDNSIDLLFTDPPYGISYLSLYHELGKLAIRVLKPSGSLVFFVGHIILDEVFKIFNEYSFRNNSINLKYWWTLAVKHSGHHSKIHPRFVFAEWKPLLWYIKGERANNLTVSNTIGDYIESTSTLKIEHKWQQSTVEAEYVIKNLTIENQTVLDPMMGSGTTGLAALNLKRRFIGIENDHEQFLMAKNRIIEFNNTKNKLSDYSIKSESPKKDSKIGGAKDNNVF